MTDTCTYQSATEGVCAAEATTAVFGSGIKADWRVGWERGIPKQFCDAHAAVVAARRNAQHREAQAARQARATRPQALGCAVCGAALVGVGIRIAEVPDGAVCDDCHRAANAAHFDDPRTLAVRTRPRRRTEESHG